MSRDDQAIVATVVSCLMSGCASVTGASTQTITVQTLDRSGKPVIGAACELKNTKGKWSVASPGSVTIARSNDNMLVTCQKDGHDDGVAALVSDTKGAMFGNILIGGGIGAIIDHNSGSAYEYPQLIEIEMGSTRVLQPSDGKDSATAATPKAVPAPAQ
jgi:hypothetical protein